MPNQLTFLDAPASDDHVPDAGQMVAPAPYQPVSATSRAAAKAMDADKHAVQTAIATVYHRAGRDGLTMREAAAAASEFLGRTIDQGTVNGRVAHGGDMAGLIVPTERRRTNTTGRAAVVFVHRLYAERKA